jgi:cytochrome P450
VLAIIGSANRDPTVFTRADQFDLERTDGHRKLTFANGPHTCLGRRLGRLQASVLFGTLARCYPDIELVEGSVTWRRDPVMRAPTTMRVVLGPKARPPV